MDFYAVYTDGRESKITTVYPAISYRANTPQEIFPIVDDWWFAELKKLTVSHILVKITQDEHSYDDPRMQLIEYHQKLKLLRNYNDVLEKKMTSSNPTKFK